MKTKTRIYRRLSFIKAASVLVLSCTNLFAQNVGFSNVSGTLPNPYFDDSGYKFEGAFSGGALDPLKIHSNNGNNCLLNSNFSSKITITKQDNGSFNLSSFNYAGDPWGGIADARASATFSNGTTSFIDFSTAGTTLKTLSTNWTSLSKVVIDFNGGTNNAYGLLDDFVFSSGSGGTSGSNNGTGLLAEYFNNIGLTGSPVTTKTEPCPNNDYGTAAPGGTSVGADNFSIRWSGQIEAPVSGTYTFTSTSDDGQRLWVNGVQIINDWNLHGPQDASGTITLTAGTKYDIKYEYYEATGGAVVKLNWAYSGQARQVIPTTRLYPATMGGTGGSNNGTGLRADFWNNIDFSGNPTVDRVDATVNNDFGTGSPAAGINSDNFCARWHGQVEAPVSGSYTFTTTSDDGQRLWVNGVQIINDWTLHGAQDASGTITLTAGQKYDIKFEYYEATGGAVARLNWAYPGQARQVIPTTRLYPGAAMTTGGGTGNPTPFDISKVSYAFTNLGGIAYYIAQHPFCDAMKTAKRWEKIPSGNGGLNETNLDANGWITSFPSGTSSAEANMFLEANGWYPTGDYVLTWQGGNSTGSDIVVYGGSSVVSENLNSNPKRRVIRVNSTSNSGMRILVSSTTIKDIKFWFPGLEGGDPNGYKNGNSSDGRSPFTPWFKDNIRPFGAFRFMDWNQTNNSKQQNWNDRKPENFAFFASMEDDGYATYTTKGSVPYEYMIMLCNELNRDMWVNIPHLATDDFINQLATLIRTRLKPNLKVWIEYSNECWNWQFSQTPWLNDNKPSGVTSHSWHYARKSQNAWNIFQNNFGGSDRIVKVAAGAWKNNLDEYFKESGFKPDVGAITGYIGGHDDANKFNNGQTVWEYIKANINNGITPDQILTKCINESQPKLKANWTSCKNDLAARGLPMVCYEAGSHINSLDQWTTTQQLQDFLVSLHSHPKFYDYQLKALQDWKDVGGRTYNMFVDVSNWDGRFGCWGHKRYYNQPNSEAHRYRAFIDFLNANPVSPRIGNELSENEINNIEDASFYPNPANSQITVYAKTNSFLTILNSSGSKVLETSIDKNETKILDLSKLNRGIYFMNFEGKVKKLILE